MVHGVSAPGAGPLGLGYDRSDLERSEKDSTIGEEWHTDDAIDRLSRKSDSSRSQSLQCVGHQDDSNLQHEGSNHNKDVEKIASAKECPTTLTDAGQPSEAVVNGKLFEVKWESEQDPQNPKSDSFASHLRKWSIVLIVSSSAFCVTCASAMYTVTYSQLQPEFGISREVATLGLSLYVVGLGIGPMFLSPLSEFYGRKPIYVVAFGMYLIWLIPCAVAQNAATMMVSRFLDGLAGSAFLSVAGGTVGDIFPKHKLSAPMMIYTASPFNGPAVAPSFSSFIVYYTSWRWVFYVLIIWAFLQLLALIFFVPETYSPVLLRRKARRLRKETGDERWIAPIEMMDRSIAKTVLSSCIRPFQLLFFEQMCLNLCLLSAILLGVLYLFFGAIPLVMERNHGFNLWQSGLSFLGICVGQLIAVSCDPLWKRNYQRLVYKNGGVSEPEFRLPPTILGAIIVPISLFGFGWTTYPWVHWIVPIIFGGLFGLGNIFCFSGIFTFLVECYPLYAASALAANSFARSSFAAAFPLFGVQMYEDLGFQWASSLLAFLALAMMPFPFLFFRYGKRLRGKSRFASIP
ncbi:MFS general substrate transporter [Polychaeton citri CBS 116435]|uniref:MFS general substrate transporter n=1 Tax=Polychaeton citri CBS 116435 TaxID=1314669 RepID=A0A9P4Q466_9PEZI|nr:MFS general substrate transporter [Polychaeton citri CBS 116435]